MQAAPVSVDVPLISNQDVYLNIALIKQYHENMPRREAERLAVEYLKRFDLGHIAHKRNPALSPEERFCAMLLRAAMVKEATILIDQPFKIIPHLKDMQFITTALKKIDDLYVSCHIYDYQWMEEKYGEL
jgi:ABC-type lipopolysaccharide export system ATPase subunit